MPRKGPKDWVPGGHVRDLEVLLKWFVALVDKRPDDMYDEEGFATDELTRLMIQSKKMLGIEE